MLLESGPSIDGAAPFACRACSRRLALFFGVGDFPERFVVVPDRQRKAADLPNRSALPLLTAVGL
jgi:hypothetical protein